MGKYKIGDIVKGKVTGIENYGIFIMLDEKTTGLIHISEISDLFVKNVSDYAEMGEYLSARVIDYDEKNDKLKLSIKNLKYREKEKMPYGIKETLSGFSNLEQSLDRWIQIKESELNKSKKTVNNVDKSNNN